MNFTDELIEKALQDSIYNITDSIESILNQKLHLIGLDLYDNVTKERLTLIRNEDTEINSYNLDVIDENNLGILIMAFKVTNYIDLQNNGIKLTLQYL